MEPLDAQEVRVLGALIEKELSTPDYYPMTLNALTAACNQKSNREPVVAYAPDEVLAVVHGLQRRGLVGTAGGAYSRTEKYRHAVAEALGLDVPARALLAELLLRGPQTAGELRGRASRMYPFERIEETQAVVDALAAREEPLVTELPRGPGQKEPRIAHLLAGPPADEPAPQHTPTAPEPGRIEQLEAEVRDLRAALDTLTDRFEAFRRQFE